MRRAAVRGEAVLALAAASLLVVALPSRRVTRLLGRPVGELAETDVRALELRHARYLGRVVERTAARLPWRPVCLPQALALRAMLRWRGIPSSAHLGVTATAPIRGHAWVSVAGRVIQGAPLTGVTELGRFA